MKLKSKIPYPKPNEQIDPSAIEFVRGMMNTDKGLVSEEEYSKALDAYIKTRYPNNWQEGYLHAGHAMWSILWQHRKDYRGELPTIYANLPLPLPVALVTMPILRAFMRRFTHREPLVGKGGALSEKFGETMTRKHPLRIARGHENAVGDVLELLQYHFHLAERYNGTNNTTS